MSRVEKNDEVIEQLGDSKKKTHGRFSCFLILLACLVLFVGFIVWEIAATGLVNIPGVSSLAFSSPKPVRMVEAGMPVEQLSESVFKTTLAKRLQEGGGELTDRSITLALPESSLTASLQNELKRSLNANIDAYHAQIAVLPNQELELFLPLQTGDQKTALVVSVVLVAENGFFDLTLRDVRLGSFRAPSSLVALLIQPFVNRELTSLNQALGTYMHVDSLTTQDGVLNASGRFTVEIKK